MKKVVIIIISFIFLFINNKNILSNEKNSKNLRQESKQENIETKKHVTIDKKYKEIYEKISHIPISINDIQKITNKNIVEINSAITMLELQGAIKQVGMNEYIRNEE